MPGKKHDIHNQANALEATRGLPHRHKMSRTLVYKRLKIGPEFLPTLRTLLPGFADGNQQTELNQTLANGGQ